MFKIPFKTVLQPGEGLKIWAKGRAATLGPKDLVTNFECWGIGIKSSTRLIDTYNIEQAFFDHHILSFGVLDSKLLEFAGDRACVKRTKTAALITSWLMDFGILSDRPKSACL